MLSRFSVRFVLAVFGGALTGLLVGVVGRYAGLDWNIFAAAAWGIMAASLALTFSYVPRTGSGSTSGRPKGR